MEKENKPTNIGIIGTLIILALMGYFAFQCVGAPKEITSPTPRPTYSFSRLQLDVQSSKYKYGYLEVHGIVTNTGDSAIYSPEIVIHVWDKTEKVKLAEDSAWPAGTLLKYMQPGEKAAVDFYVMIGSEPLVIRYSFTTPDVPYLDVNFPK